MRAVRWFDGMSLRDGTLRARPATAIPERDWVPELVEGPAPAAAPPLDGVITGRFTDHHVHLQLVDHTLLTTSRLGRVVDLGADVDWIRTVATPDVAYAGPFLTAPGGYPSDRAWAPAGSVCEIADAAAAASVVAGLTAAGVSHLKVTAHSAAGPVLDDDLMRTLVHLAAEYRLPLIAHAEGAGQAQRLARLGVTVLAHAPFSERLTDDEIAEQAASVSWISTLAIHGPDTSETTIAIDNVRRFFAVGGDVLYGTDLGNGPMPVDLNERELAALREADVDGLDLLSSLAPADPLTAIDLLLLPDGDPARARHLTLADLEA